jgi:hypothetical protein
MSTHYKGEGDQIMIRRQTIKSLNLKQYTKTACDDFYGEVSEKYKSTSDFESALQKSHFDPEALNKLWWVLNYHSELMDNNRRLRAIIEKKLDMLVESSYKGAS